MMKIMKIKMMKKKLNKKLLKIILKKKKNLLNFQIHSKILVEETIAMEKMIIIIIIK